jgi:hypothetical protein
MNKLIFVIVALREGKPTYELIFVVEDHYAPVREAA